LATHEAHLHLPGVRQIAKLTRNREILKYNKKTQDTVFLITDMHYNQLTAKDFLELKRDYWLIENSLHYRKDFVFGEDRSTIRAKFGPQNMSSLRNFALSLLLVNDIGNVKRCVDNIRYQAATMFHL
jgi:predicted transposase YbfD/YdcC